MSTAPQAMTYNKRYNKLGFFGRKREGVDFKRSDVP
jgi:hypothetical protein